MQPHATKLSLPGSAVADAEAPEEHDSTRSLVIRVAGRVYACDVTQVRQVVRLTRLVRFPCAPDWIAGVINVRGSIVTVVDAATVLHGQRTERSRAAVLLVDIGPRGVGLLVEQVSDVRSIRSDEAYIRLDVRSTVAGLISIAGEQ